MKTYLPAALIFFALAVLQLTLGDVLAIRGIKPGFDLVLLYALSITAGEVRGMAYGALAGLIQDCLSGGYPGLFMSGYALAGFLAGRAGRRLFNVGESANFTGIFVLSLVQGIYTAIIMSTFIEGYDTFGTMWRFALPQAFYNAIAGSLLFWLFKEQLARRVPWLKGIRQLHVRL
jgi:rod shape-determining protein MreD